MQKKDFKTLDEQIAILQNRNLIIDDPEEAKRYLLSSNYYNIINGYSKYFPRNGDIYTTGTTFNEVTRLYLFDKEIKERFFKAIIAAESHLKAIFAYRFAEEYPNTPYAYLNISCYDPGQTLSVIDTISHLSKTINIYKNKKGTSIYHYIVKYNDVPIWVLINYLDFGELRFMLQSSTKKLQNKVAYDFTDFINQHFPAGQFSPETMMNFLGNINDVRNVCAHNNRLLGFRCKHDIKYWKALHCNYGIQPNSQRYDVYSVFLAIQCFLSQSEYGFLHNGIRKSMHSHLNNHMKSISPDAILKTLGFPPGWYNKPKLPQ